MWMTIWILTPTTSCFPFDSSCPVSAYEAQNSQRDRKTENEEAPSTQQSWQKKHKRSFQKFKLYLFETVLNLSMVSTLTCFLQNFEFKRIRQKSSTANRQDHPGRLKKTKNHKTLKPLVYMHKIWITFQVHTIASFNRCFPALEV